MSSNPYLTFVVVIAVVLGVIVLLDTVVIPMLEVDAKCQIGGNGYNKSNGRCNPTP